MPEYCDCGSTWNYWLLEMIIANFIANSTILVKTSSDRKAPITLSGVGRGVSRNCDTLGGNILSLTWPAGWWYPKTMWCFHTTGHNSWKLFVRLLAVWYGLYSMLYFTDSDTNVSTPASSTKVALLWRTPVILAYTVAWRYQSTYHVPRSPCMDFDPVMPRCMPK